MRRIVVIASSMSGVACATRIKRRLPEDEVNIILPAALDEARSSGPAGRRVMAPNPELLVARRVGVIEARDIMPDIANREIAVTSDRGSLPVRYSDLVVEVPAEARLPRALQAIANVIAMPVSGFSTSVKRCDELLAACAAAGEAILVVGGGMDALDAVLLAREGGAPVVWLWPEDRTAPWVEPQLEALLLRTLGSGVRLVRCPDVPLGRLAFMLDDAGMSLQGIRLPDGRNFSGSCVLWAGSVMARHPLLREEGFILDALGRMVREDGADAAIRLIGNGVAAPSALLAGCHAPAYAGGDETASLLAAVTPEAIAGNDVPFPGALGVRHAHMPGLTLYRAGFTLAEASAAGIAAEHAIAALPADVEREDALPPGAGEHSLILTLVCDKESERLVGVQVLGSGTGDARAEGLFGMGLAALANGSSLAELALGESPGASGALLRYCASILRHKLAGVIQGITPDELLASAEAGAAFFILDLRSKPDWEARRLPDAYNIPFTQLKKRLQQEVPRNTALVLVSATSADAFNAACMLADLGATALYVLDGGMDLWPYPAEGVAGREKLE